MRTTLSLDDDVAALLERVRKAKDASLKEVVNAALREGLVRMVNLIPDTHLAALAIEHGLTVCSTDGDFARFPDLRWVNPLREALR